ncbi:hypothetical protein ACQEU3_12695 [Spirillospora sp. CA-253888]
MAANDDWAAGPGDHFTMRTQTKDWLYGGAFFVAVFGGLLLTKLIGMVPGVALCLAGLVTLFLWSRHDQRWQRELTGLGEAEMADLRAAGWSGRAPKDPGMDRAARLWADDRLKRLARSTWMVPVMAVVGGAVGYYSGFPRGEGARSAFSWIMMTAGAFGVQQYQRKRISRMRAEVEKRASESPVENEPANSR